jgi:nucleotide-binding universal stress UspA family protein
MLPIRRILVPIDWSEPSDEAFRLAASLAREHAAELLVLYVVPLAAVMYGPPPESYLEHLLEELRRVRPSDPKVRARYLLVEGAPAAAILSAAGESHCDLIVMGTHGRRGLNRLLSGSVAEAVVRKAPCPVLTVKARVPADSPELLQGEGRCGPDGQHGRRRQRRGRGITFRVERPADPEEGLRA